MSWRTCASSGHLIDPVFTVPELPEVEGLAGFLDGRTRGRLIERVEVLSFAAVKTAAPPVSDLVGRAVAGWSRHGKFLDLRTDPELHLVAHFARAGWVRWREAVPAGERVPAARAARALRPGPVALRVALDDGCGFDLTEAGTQKRLAVYVVPDPTAVPGIAGLGIDPLDPEFTAERLGELLHGRSERLKSVLADQGVIAGVGNAYSDEALHAARLSPFEPAGSLSAEEVARLHAGLLEVLRDALERSAGLPAAELKDEKRAGMRVHGRTGLPCPVCGGTVREIAFATRAWQYCPTCQTGGRLYADRRLSRLLK